jgi:hypothetical protein
MIENLNRMSWLLFNIGVPVFGPIFLLPLLRFSRLYRRACARIVTRAVQDGQLLWVVISMCAAACYEIGHAMDGALPGSKLTLLLAGLVWHALFVVVASVVVSFVAVDALASRPHLKPDEEPDKSLMWLSLAMTAMTAASFSASHYSLT